MGQTLAKLCTFAQCAFLLVPILSARPAIGAGHAKITTWLTTPDRAALLAKQPGTLPFTTSSTPQAITITVDPQQRFQSIDGFGFALTGGSAQLMVHMEPKQRAMLIQEMFGHKKDDIHVSYLRVSVGASDMNDHVFSYDDLPDGEQDPQLASFSIAPDRADVIPVLKQILKINPSIKILASPWSAPAWMKNNARPKGGELKPESYDVYARYLVRYLKAMQGEGIRIDALTMQNEPLNPKNTPSLKMEAAEQATFLKQSLGPLLRREGLSTKVILYDHNCDVPEYPLTILDDHDAAQYADGSGFHLYEGETSAMSKVHAAHPEKNVYFTEQMVIDKDGAKDLAIARPEAKVVVGAVTNWSRNVLLWNLAADPHKGPHTSDGGCPVCEGAITIDGSAVTRNLAYYTIAQVSKFVPPDSVHVASETAGASRLVDVAFETPEGRFVLLVVNQADSSQSFGIRFGTRTAQASLAAGAVATYVW
ncbi:glycoside hydrolase family 30 beta sandwich domain-containing protein [Acidipila sp. EB88]|uniref:glycoside hydrolase family 30 protein n=1 Tax=Acidipila sp. EB88 TaxID=2305226 RepID=UPI000F5FCC1D|nr:glycoside hydrolase family 30 beta sandwich domain-containing protein [Acidipila sp. EB88]RRA49851.1 glucosylceramidase [Acidipila sp. EB88]